MVLIYYLIEYTNASLLLCLIYYALKNAALFQPMFGSNMDSFQFLTSTVSDLASLAVIWRYEPHVSTWQQYHC